MAVSQGGTDGREEKGDARTAVQARIARDKYRTPKKDSGIHDLKHPWTRCNEQENVEI